MLVGLIGRSLPYAQLWLAMTMRVKECVTDAGKELGYPKMKPEQLEVAATFIEGRDVFAVLPTGFGKSFQPMWLEWRRNLSCWVNIHRQIIPRTDIMASL